MIGPYAVPAYGPEALQCCSQIGERSGEQTPPRRSTHRLALNEPYNVAMGGLKPIRIVVVGPTDVDPEKALVDAAVLDMASSAAKRGFALQPPRRWERLDARASPEGVQLGIENDLQIEDCDVVIAILWKKFGIPDQAGYSPTAREIRKALAANRASGGARPKVKVYFSKQPVTSTAEDLQEQGRILKFKEEIADQVRYREYERLDRFKLQIREDLGNLLDDLTLTRQAWSCTATSSVVLARSEGYTEPVGDIRLTLRGPHASLVSGKVNLQVSVFLDTHVSSRLFSTEGPMLDVTLVAETDESVWRGETRKPRTNAVVFGPFSRTVPDFGFDEDFIIKGIRVDSTLGQSAIGALVEVVISDDSGTALATARAPVDLALNVRSTFFTALAERTPIAGSDGLVVHTVLLSFQEAFAGTFKTRQEEGGWRMSGEGYGSILAAYFFGLPSGWEVYATLYDLSFKTTGGRAVATKVDQSGLPQERRSTLGKLFWNGLIPMVHVENGQLAAWQVISAERSFIIDFTQWEYSRWDLTRDLVFGVAFVGNGDLPPIKSPLSVSAFRAPMFDRGLDFSVSMASATLPIPRFKQVTPPWPLQF